MVYKPQNPKQARRTQQPAAAAAAAVRCLKPGTKADTQARDEAKARLAKLLNKHLEPREPRALAQQDSQQQQSGPSNPATGNEARAENQEPTQPQPQPTADSTYQAQTEWAAQQPPMYLGEGDLPPPSFLRRNMCNSRMAVGRSSSGDDLPEVPPPMACRSCEPCCGCWVGQSGTTGNSATLPGRTLI